MLSSSSRDSLMEVPVPQAALAALARAKEAHEAAAAAANYVLVQKTVPSSVANDMLSVIVCDRSARARAGGGPEVVGSVQEKFTC